MPPKKITSDDIRNYRKYRPVVKPDDPAPLCLCGCGLPVTLSLNDSKRDGIFKGQPFNYRVGHHHRLNATESGERLNKGRMKDNIPVEKFREVIAHLREEKGWSWLEINEITGCNVSRIMYDKRRRSVGREWAKHVFMRLAGYATPPTQRELHKFAKEQRHNLRFNQEMTGRGIANSQHKTREAS